MYVSPGNLVEGELIERGRARQVYQTIVNSRRDPAILEQIGDNLFKMRVFPIPARGVKRILLDYTVPLEADGAGSAFRLPLFFRSGADPGFPAQRRDPRGGAARRSRVPHASRDQVQAKRRRLGRLRAD